MLKNWKIAFSGFAYAKAETLDDAIKLYEDGDTIYEESKVDTELSKEVEEFECEI